MFDAESHKSLRIVLDGGRFAGHCASREVRARQRPVKRRRPWIRAYELLSRWLSGFGFLLAGACALGDAGGLAATFA